jgi:uncharacterized protein (TIGR02594 family)
MKTPPGYEWLSKVREAPNTIKLGLAEHGVTEVVGKGSNRTIIGWRDELNQAGVKIAGFSDDDIPWCGLFAAIVCYRRVRNPAEVPASPLWARNWLRYGLATKVPALGDILVFSRGSGGHVGFYVAEDRTAYHVLGGNQGNRVSVMRLAKSRLLGARRPPYNVAPHGAQPFVVAATGGLSMNEA